MTSEAIDFGLVTGFIVVLASTLVLDKAGDYLYHRGIAKPFYLRGYRLHHRNFLLALIPSGYVVLATLIYLHFIRILWSSFWPSAEVTLALAGLCLTFDLSWDALSSSEKRKSLFHHEWVYFLVPAYVFTHLVALV